jgi:hypothetical protein
MLVTTTNYHSIAFDKEMVSLIDPDNSNEWAVRYAWIQHKTENDVFLENYFLNGNMKGMNVRKASVNLKEHWDIHNRIFELSKDNGDLVWRVKAFNKFSNSIDYIEVWRTTEIIKKYFMIQENSTILLPDGSTWAHYNRRQLELGIFETGFIARNWLPIQTISKNQALNFYEDFIDRFILKDRCIINTPYNPILNP